MKLELLDAYNIRARLSASIILLAPIAITLFSIFEEALSFATSSVILLVMLAFTNYVPILQRRINSNIKPPINYAAEMLSLQDPTIDELSKKRYFKKLASLDDTFKPFLSPDDSDAFRQCRESAILYLRNNTRENRLVQEENINYGFCRNLLANKTAGIIICLTCLFSSLFYSFCKYCTLLNIPTQLFFAFISNLLILFSWVFGINEKVSVLAAKRYSEALLMAIDTIEEK